MCIVIDANTICRVFDPESAEHADYRPVRDWIVSGRGKMVYGGTKYKEELFKLPKYLRVLNQLKNARKVVTLDDKDVDQHQAIVQSIESHRDFDDAHIVAIFRVSRCCLLCSADKRSFRFIKMRKLYPKKHRLPKIYCGRENADLLCEENIARVCRAH